MTANMPTPLRTGPQGEPVWYETKEDENGEYCCIYMLGRLMAYSDIRLDAQMIVSALIIANATVPQALVTASDRTTPPGPAAQPRHVLERARSLLRAYDRGDVDAPLRMRTRFGVRAMLDVLNWALGEDLQGVGEWLEKLLAHARTQGWTPPAPPTNEGDPNARQL